MGETAALAKRTRFQLAMLRGKMARIRRSAARSLSGATQRLHRKMNAASAAQMAIVAGQHAALRGAAAAAKSALKVAKSQFGAKLNTLANLSAANNRRFEAGLRRITGVAHAWKKNSARTRALMKENTRTMNRDLSKAIARSIQMGEARAKAVEARAKANVKSTMQGLRTLATEKIEAMANKVYQTVQGNRQKIADNYLSLKAYAATAADLIVDYLQKGKGRNLSSVGDLLQTVAAASDVKTPMAEGMGFGGDSLPLIFSGKTVKVDNSISKINGLVDEYITTLAQVKSRWPLGLGKYLLAKLEIAMAKAGALEVDKIEGKSGNYVFVNAHAVGLSSKLSDFEGLAVRMANYESKLAGLTGHLSGKKTAGSGPNVPPPEWQGN